MGAAWTEQYAGDMCAAFFDQGRLSYGSPTNNLLHRFAQNRSSTCSSELKPCHLRECKPVYAVGTEEPIVFFLEL